MPAHREEQKEVSEERFRSYRGKGRANQAEVHDPADPSYYGNGKGKGKGKGGKGKGKGKDKGDKGKSFKGTKGKGKGKDSAKAASPTEDSANAPLEPTKLPPHRAGMSGTRTVITLIPAGTMPHMMNSTHIPIIHVPPRQENGERRREENEGQKEEAPTRPRATPPCRTPSKVTHHSSLTREQS